MFQGANGNFYSRTIRQMIGDIREFQLSNFSDDILETIRKGNEREIKEKVSMIYSVSLKAEVVIKT